LCEAPAATVVNNCAAALMLVIRLFAGHRERNEVLISRGELVQIGGGFRVPEILRASGARLREVGTTNRTTPDDYQSAIGERSAFILCVHRSNFYMAGFVQSPTVQELSDLARPVGLPLVVDLGSGATFPTKQLGGGEQEPIVAQTLAQGADLVTFSGDKLLGGPQAGIIAGETKAVASLKRHPLFRALRCDKLTLAALEATVELHLSGREMEIPVRRMLAIPLAELESRAQRIVSALAEVGIPAAIGKSEAQVGGGSLPRTLIPSICVELADDSTAPLLADRLRLGNPPIIGIIRDRRLRLDLRTVAAEQDELLVTAVGKAFRA
jgi:L-seryl-tRNA(Ser) seleniumtransferase